VIRDGAGYQGPDDLEPYQVRTGLAGEHLPMVLGCFFVFSLAEKRNLQGCAFIVAGVAGCFVPSLGCIVVSRDDPTASLASDGCGFLGLEGLA